MSVDSCIGPYALHMVNGHAMNTIDFDIDFVFVLDYLDLQLGE